MASHAMAAAIKFKSSSEIEEISLGWDDLEEAKLFLKTNKRYVHVNTLAGITE